MKLLGLKTIFDLKMRVSRALLKSDAKRSTARYVIKNERALLQLLYVLRGRARMRVES